MQEQRRIKLENTADIATKWIGSIPSVIVHTLVFIISFTLPLLGIVSFERMLLVLTTMVSLEAIYLSIFIQMSVNKNSQDIEIIQEGVGEIQEDIGEIQGDIDEIQGDIDEIQEDIDEIQEDIVEEDNDDYFTEELIIPKDNKQATLESIEGTLLKLQKEIDLLKKK